MRGQSGELHASASIEITVRVEGRVIANFAWQHMKAATLFRKQVIRLETENKSQPFGEFFEEIRAYCSACIMSTTASLEALINELFVEPNGPLRKHFADFDTEFWGVRGIEKMPILKKYNRALKIMNGPFLDTGADSYKDVKALIGVRDTLVHFKPMWDEPEPSVAELQRMLKDRFTTSPFPDATADFFAVRCMSASCTSWALRSAFQFIEDFAATAGSDLARDKFGAFQTLRAEADLLGTSEQS